MSALNDGRPQIYACNGEPGRTPDMAPSEFWRRAEVVFPDATLMVMVWPSPVDEGDFGAFMCAAAQRIPDDAVMMWAHEPHTAHLAG